MSQLRDDIEARYRRNREVLIAYLKSIADQADWHVVADAACDWCETEAEWQGVQHAREQ